MNNPFAFILEFFILALSWIPIPVLTVLGISLGALLALAIWRIIS